MENKIREIVAEIVGENENEIKTIGIEDSLIELGVDSMNSIEIVVELEETFGISIDVEELTIDSIGSIKGLMELVEASAE